MILIIEWNQFPNKEPEPDSVTISGSKNDGRIPRFQVYAALEKALRGLKSNSIKLQEFVLDDTIDCKEKE